MKSIKFYYTWWFTRIRFPSFRFSNPILVKFKWNPLQKSFHRAFLIASIPLMIQKSDMKNFQNDMYKIRKMKIKKRKWISQIKRFLSMYRINPLIDFSSSSSSYSHRLATEFLCQGKEAIGVGWSGFLGLCFIKNWLRKFFKI